MRIVREGWSFILGCLIASDLFLAGAIVLKSGILTGIAVIFFLATAFCGWFFRDPARVIPSGDRLFLARRQFEGVEVIEGKDPISAGPRLDSSDLPIDFCRPHIFSDRPSPGRFERFKY